MATISREAHQKLESLHAMIYFAPESQEKFGGVGLSDPRTSYFAGRAAAMGAVGPGVVTATFYNFNPAIVSEAIPKAWEIASPDDVLAARFEAAEAALRRLLGDDLAASDEVAEAADLARRAVQGCTPEARPLYAAHADLEWPTAVLPRLWHAATLLREYRGDGHLWALQRAGLGGLEAVVLQAATGRGLTENFVKQSRGWSDDEWTGAQNSLRERGWLDDAGALTEAGASAREAIEVETDEVDLSHWTELGDEATTRLLELGARLSRAVVQAGAFPRAAIANP